MKLFGITITGKSLVKLAIAIAPLVAAIKQVVRDAKNPSA
jgi:hypothetical protein